MEGPHYQKWLKRINMQIDKRKLDLEELYKEILESCSVNQLVEEDTVEKTEPDIIETLDK